MPWNTKSFESVFCKTDRCIEMMLGCLPRPAAQTRDVGLHVAVAGSELSECILRSTVATRVHGIAKKDGRGV